MLQPSHGPGTGVPQRGSGRTVGWALALVVLAPFLAETVASSNTPAVLLPVLLPYYAVVYGLPALLLRELWVRDRLTPVRLLAYGIAYTAFNEGVVAATWFKLSPGAGRVLSFSAEQAGHWAGVNWPVALNLVVFHTVYSLMVPITLVHALAARRGSGAERRPWLRRRGAVWCTVPVLVVLAGALTPRATAETCAGPAASTCAAGRWVAAGLVLLLGAGVVLATTSRRRFAPAPAPAPAPAHWPSAPAHGSWPPPALRPPGPPVEPGGPPYGGSPRLGPPRSGPPSARPWLRVTTGAGFALVFFLTFFALPLMGLPAAAVLAGLALLAVVHVVAVRWCRTGRRDLRGDVLLITGALLPGMLVSLNAWHVGQPLAALGAAVLLWSVLRNAGPDGGPAGTRPAR